MIYLIIIAVLIIVIVVQELRRRKSVDDVIIIEEKYVDTLNSLKTVENEKHYLNDQVKEVNKDIGELLDMYIDLLTTNRVVYVNSSFYSNYSFYKGRYYAKVNNKTTNNKATAIPFINVSGHRHKVLDLVRFSTMISNAKGDLFKPNLNTRNLEALIEIRDECIIHKEDVIKNLGNKMLKGYK